MVGPSGKLMAVETVTRSNRSNTMAKKLVFSLLTCLLIGVAATAAPAELRVWRTSDGKQAVRAEAVDAKYDRESKTTLVYLKKADGTIIPFEGVHTFSDEQVEWFKAGSALNVVRRKVAESRA